MRVVVLLGLGADVRVPPYRDPRSGRVREEWSVRETDPAAASALDLALELKAARPGSHLTLVHLGSPDAEPWLRHALARGADRVVRVWDDEIAETHVTTGIHTAAKAVVLAAAVQAAGADLVLAGAAGVLDAGGHLGVLVAAHLGIPSVTQVVALSPGENPGTLEMARGLDRGYRERVEAKLPLVATVSGIVPTGDPSANDAVSAGVSVAALLVAYASEVVTWSLADLGVALDAVRRSERALRFGTPRQPRPRLRPLAAPDSSLPAFDRILKLIEGSVRRREGRIVRRSSEETADEIFRSLRDEGWLDHLRPGGDDTSQPDGAGRRSAQDPRGAESRADISGSRRDTGTPDLRT